MKYASLSTTSCDRSYATRPCRVERVDIGASLEETLASIFSTLHQYSGLDFRHYERAVILRCLKRRLEGRGVTDLRAYCQLLQDDRREPNALFQDLLIGVTGFFRNRNTFHVLEKTILPRILADKGPQDHLRAWVAACSTGEEAYSLGMILVDQTAKMMMPPAIQIFASDINKRAIAFARRGRYRTSVAAHIPKDQLRFHFKCEEDFYSVRKLLREKISFNSHNLLHDSAYSQLDLITCRNFLIYLNRTMHRHVLENFYSALNPGGFLFLGSAESADIAPDLFVPVDAVSRIYRRNER